MMKRINIAVIGCGHWGPNYIRVFQRIKGVSISHICDLDNEKCKELSLKHPYIRSTQDVRQLFKNRDIHAVIIATPARTHYELVKKALASGKHVLVEKPLAMTVGEARELMRLSQKCKRVLMPGHIFEHHYGIQQLKKIIKRREFGSVYYMYSRRTNLGPIRNDVNAVWDLALHDISIFNYITDSVPEKVEASGFSYLRGHLHDVGFITLYYPGNIVAHIHVSWLDPRKIREIVIVASKKMLMFDDLDFVHPVRIYDKAVSKHRHEISYNTFDQFKMLVRNGDVVTPKIAVREPLLQECKEFIRLVRNEVFAREHLQRAVSAVEVLNKIDKII